jgi:hypothetical protein
VAVGGGVVPVGAALDGAPVVDGGLAEPHAATIAAIKGTTTNGCLTVRMIPAVAME